MVTAHVVLDARPPQATPERAFDIAAKLGEESRTTSGVRVVPGDYDGDGITDLALTGPFGWGSIPVAFGQGSGNFTTTNQQVQDFPSWATTPGVKVVGGRF